jgi:hypothetical protein
LCRFIVYSVFIIAIFQHFHDVAYKAESRGELLNAINEFLDESIVLPPGDWDQKTLLPIMDMARKRARVKRKQKHKEEEKQGNVLSYYHFEVNYQLYDYIT